jgi:hypothetical protein
MLFGGQHARGTGVGRRLLDTVVEDIPRAELFPCLGVLPTPSAALGLYEAMGCRQVMTLRPAWLAGTSAEGGPGVPVVVLPPAGLARITGCQAGRGTRP